MDKPMSFDLSLNSTGVWLPTGEGVVVSGLGPKFSDQHRHSYLFDQFRELLDEYQPNVIRKEAIFVHPRRLNGSLQLLQVHGILTAAVAMMDPRPTIFDVSPTALKAWATEFAFGEKDGKADKAEMERAARAIGFDGPSQNDIVDAYLVHRYFEEH